MIFYTATISLYLLFFSSDVNTENADKKSIMMYVTTMYDILGKYKDGGDGDGSELDQVYLYYYVLMKPPSNIHNL